MKTVTVKKLLNGNGALSLYEETEEVRFTAYGGIGGGGVTETPASAMV